MKKFFAAALVTMLIGATLISAGCSSTGSGPTQSTPNPAQGVGQNTVTWEGRDALLTQVVSGMNLPTYLPKGFEQPVTHVGAWRGGGSVAFTTKDDRQHVTVTYQPTADKDPLMMVADAQNLQEVQVGGKSALAYSTDKGWNVTWTQYGHGYTVQTDTSLEEARRIAESIK